MCRWKLIEFIFCSLFTVVLCILSEQYRLISERLDASLSISKCAGIDMQQVIIKDEATYAEVVTYLQELNPSSTSDMWVGMHWDQNHQFYRWTHNNAKVVESVRWCSDEPTYLTKPVADDCVLLDKIALCLETSSCETKYFSLCQARYDESQTEAGSAIINQQETITPCPICDATSDQFVTCDPCPTCDVTTNQQVTCEPCPTFKVTTNQHVTCEPCPTCDFITNQHVTCEPCPTCDVTTNQPVTCEPCPTSDDTTNKQVTCEPCPTNDVTTNQHVTCEPCPTCDATTNQHVTCTCEPCPTSDATTYKQVKCDPCPTCDVTTNQQVTCEPCPTWDFITNQHVTCEPCPTCDVTTNQPVTCEPCPSDDTTNKQVTCEPCPICDVTTNQQVTCEPCPTCDVNTSGSVIPTDTTANIIINQSTAASQSFNQTAFQDSLYKVKKEETGSYRRRNTSAYDGRFSSKVIGVTGVIILVIVCCIFPALDMINLAKKPGKKRRSKKRK